MDKYICCGYEWNFNSGEIWKFCPVCGKKFGVVDTSRNHPYGCECGCTYTKKENTRLSEIEKRLDALEDRLDNTGMPKPPYIITC